MSHNRVVQWAAMNRTWWLYDAKCQCPFKSAELLSMYLEGRHKPLYHPLSDVGDHVVVVNTKHIAMAEDLWRKHQYKHDTGYVRGKSQATAWRLHELDETLILQKAVKFAGPKNLLRPNIMRRLHLYPEEEVPDNIMGNVSDVIRQIQVVPKTFEDFTQEEIDNFPKLFDWPKDHVMFEKKSLDQSLIEVEKQKEMDKKKKK